MFCPSCGAEAARELRYCKRCGAKLGAAADDQPAAPRPKVAGLIWAISLAIVFVTVGGFGAVFGFLIEVGRAASNFLLLLLGLILLVVLVVDVLLVRQVSRLLGFHLHHGDYAAQTKKPVQPAPPAPQLEATRAPALSDLEQATRTLDADAGERRPN